jgi:hypothetical protein
MIQHGGKARLRFNLTSLVYKSCLPKFQVECRNRVKTQPSHYGNHQSIELNLDAIHVKF